MHISRQSTLSGLIALGATLILLFPIFSSGPILTLDSVASPVINSKVFFFTHNAVFFQKIFLFLTVFIGILGCLAFLNNISPLSKIAVAGVWVTSPFYSERIAIGQWHLLTAMGLIAWLIVLIRKTTVTRNTLIYPLMAFVILATLYWYPRSLSFFLIIFWSLLIAWVIEQKGTKRHHRLFIAIAAFVASTQITRVLVLVIAGQRVEAVGSHQLPLFEMGQGPLGLKIIQAISQLGFWAERAQRLPFNLANDWYWYIPGLVWFVLGGIGLFILYQRKRFFGRFFISLYILSLIIVLSNNPAFHPEAILNVYNTLGLMGLRETGKFMALMLIAQSIGVGYCIEYFLKNHRQPLKYIILGSLVVPLIIVPVIISILKWGITPIKFPPSLIDFAQLANKEDKRTIIFPWHRFQVYPFSNGKVIDQLGPVLFDEYIFNEMFEYNDILTYSPEKWQQEMARLTSGDTLGDDILPLLNEREITLVVIFKTNDYQKYIDWAMRNNLTVVRDEAEFIAYKI